MLSFKRKRILRERTEAVDERLAAAKAFVAGIREAEAALATMKAANDKFYRSDNQAEQAALASVRRGRERVFIFHVVRELVAEAPMLARMLELRVSVTGAMPLVAFVEHTSQLDVNAVDPTEQT
jgi:hypothetical protein